VVDVEQLVDPELEGLLRELGSRPRSVFLRTSRKDAMRVLRSRTTQGVGPMAVPDALERELVTAHREELAEILKQACRTRLLEGERERLVMMPYKGVRERHQPTPVHELRRRLQQSAQREREDSLVGDAECLHSALSSNGRGDMPVLELAALGQRIQPSDTWRLLSAISFAASKEFTPALALAREVMHGWPREEDAVRALEVLALYEGVEGSPSRALEYQDQACSVLGEYPIGEINRLRYSLLALQERRALDSSERLGAMMTPEHPLLLQSYEANMVRRRQGYWTPSTDAVRLAITLEAKLSNVAREVSRVFH
jgi:hypothetical protein